MARRRSRAIAAACTSALLVACGTELTGLASSDATSAAARSGRTCTISPLDVAGNRLGAYLQQHLRVGDCETVALEPGTYRFVRGRHGAGAFATIAASHQSRRRPLVLTAASPAAPPTVTGSLGLYDPDWVTVSDIHFVGTQRCSRDRSYVVKGALAMAGGEHWTIERNEINGALDGSFCGKALVALTNTSRRPPYGEVPQAYRIRDNCLHDAGRPSPGSPPEPAFAPGEFHLLYAATIVTTGMPVPHTSVVRRNIFFGDPGGFAVKLNATRTTVDHNTFDDVGGAEIVQENGGPGNTLSDPPDSAPRTGLETRRNLVVDLHAARLRGVGRAPRGPQAAFDGFSLAHHGPVPAVTKWRILGNSIYAAGARPGPAVAPRDDPRNPTDAADYIAALRNVRMRGTVRFNVAGSCAPGHQTAYRPSSALPYGLFSSTRRSSRIVPASSSQLPSGSATNR